MAHSVTSQRWIIFPHPLRIDLLADPCDTICEHSQKEFLEPQPDGGAHCGPIVCPVVGPHVACGRPFWAPNTDLPNNPAKQNRPRGADNQRSEESDNQYVHLVTTDQFTHSASVNVD